MIRIPLLAAALCLGCSPEPASAPPATAPGSAAAPSAASSPPVAPARAPATLAPDTDAQLQALERAKAALARGAEAEAVVLFRSAALGPASGAGVSAGLAAADLLDNADRAPEAKALYRRMLDQAGHVPEVQFAAGRFFAGQSDTPRAIAAFKKAVELEPDFLPAHPLLAALLAQNGRQTEAGEVLVDYERRLSLQLRHVRASTTPVADRLAIIDLLATLDDERVQATMIELLGDAVPALRGGAAGVIADDPDPKSLVALSNAALAETHPVTRELLKANLDRARANARAQAPTAPPE